MNEMEAHIELASESAAQTLAASAPAAAPVSRSASGPTFFEFEVRRQTTSVSRGAQVVEHCS
jgi:hypothetical protein